MADDPSPARNPGVFGKTLREMRLRAGLSQEELAETAELTLSAISSLERGLRRHPHPSTLARLARALGLKPEANPLFEAAWRDRTSLMPEQPLVAATVELVGRRGQVEQITAALLQVEEGQRLHTLAGPGGVGKTQLALTVADALRPAHADGVVFADFSSLGRAGRVTRVLASSLGLGTDDELTLLTALRTRDTVLLLDNCEHVIDECTRVTAGLLALCPRLLILATSREPLGLANERVWRVEPLQIPQVHPGIRANQIVDIDAVRLFATRAAQSGGEFELTDENAVLVARVCEAVGGLPLGLELAAGLTRVLSIEEIVSRLADPGGLPRSSLRVAPSRQHTLAATLDWSFELLPDPEREFFLQLAVFAGGWTLDEAEAVCTGGARALELLVRLVDKSLVVAIVGDSQTRYRMLEPVRRYALGRLTESGELDSIRERHALAFLSLAESQGSHVNGPGQMRAVHRLNREQENFAAALEWAEECGNADLGLRLGAALSAVWDGHAYSAEGQRRMLALLRMPASGTTANVRIAALLGAGAVAHWQGAFEEALALLHEALESSRELGDARLTAEATMWVGATYRRKGDTIQGERFGNEAVLLSEEAGDALGAARSIHNLSLNYAAAGDLEAARRLGEEAVTALRALGDLRHASRSSTALALTALLLRDTARANELLRWSLPQHVALDDRYFAGQALMGFAGVLADLGRDEDGARLVGASQRMNELLAMRLAPSVQLTYDVICDRVKSGLSADAFEAARAEGELMSATAAIALATA
jgi:predicted ATPase/DNA-binding XRE family transcriptional regulator